MVSIIIGLHPSSAATSLIFFGLLDGLVRANQYKVAYIVQSDAAKLRQQAMSQRFGSYSCTVRNKKYATFHVCYPLSFVLGQRVFILWPIASNCESKSLII